MLEQGGVTWAQAQAEKKAAILYSAIEKSLLYKCSVRPQDRSRMNVSFTLSDEVLNQRFLDQAAQRGLMQLKGHQSVGGIRASIYNAMPLQGVQILAEFMHEFEQMEA